MNLHLTADQARRFATIFPRHPVVWLAAAGLIAVILVRRPPPDTSSAGVPVPPSSRALDAAGDRAARSRQYAWLSKRGRAAYQPLAGRIAPPDGYERIPLTEGSFGDWLRHLPCLPEGACVLDGRGKPARAADDAAIAAVIDLAPTNRGLLGAANMAIRLRAEYLWAVHRMDDIRLCFTSGAACPWSRFVAGERPSVQGKTVTWHALKPGTKTDASRVTFIAYLESLLPYTGMISLDHDSVPVTQGAVEPGDLFVLLARKNGHAVVVLDAASGTGGERRVLLGEGFTPPQSFHVLRQSDGSVWFKLERATLVSIPTWPAPLAWRTWRRWPE